MTRDPRRRARPAHARHAAHDPLRGLRRLATATTAATLLLIAMGGAVRATDSGLACPDWPACYGQWIPPADMHMWFEHSHRLWAGVVGLLVLWLMTWALASHRDRPLLWVPAVVSLLLVLVQAALGAAVVLLHLRAGLVTSHLGMSLVILACLLLISVASAPEGAGRGRTARRVGAWSAAAAGLVLAQALLGGQATGVGAAYVLNAVPFWSVLDETTGHVREVLHLVHRIGGYVVAAVVIALAIHARRASVRDRSAPRWVSGLPALAACLVVVQAGLGIANVLTQASVSSAIAHLTVASWLWAVLVLAALLGLLPRAAGAERQPGRVPGTERRPGRVPDGAERQPGRVPGTERELEEVPT